MQIIPGESMVRLVDNSARPIAVTDSVYCEEHSTYIFLKKNQIKLKQIKLIAHFKF